eukprot:m.121229 g.121229  ORF g.121229 m.121229 type:complete len:620 (+) comp15631_c0_seq7:73-1932(+)
MGFGPPMGFRPPVQNFQPPPGHPWRQVATPDGKPYWHNVVTNETSWTPPAAPQQQPLMAPPVAQMPPQQHQHQHQQHQHQQQQQHQQHQQPAAAQPAVPPVVSGDWQEHTHADGRKYYYNTVSRQSVWVKPAEFDAGLQAGNATKPAEPVVEVKEEKKEIPVYATKEEAKDAFRSLLSERKCHSTWPWDKIVRAISDDPRYEVLKKGEKKQVWNAWKGKRAKEEKEEHRIKARQAREALFKFFVAEEGVSRELKWPQVLALYRMFPELDNKVLKEREMETVFEDALFEKEKAEKDEFHEACKARQQKFKAILASLPDFKSESTWDDAMDMLKDVPAFAEDPDFKEDGILDCLMVFEDRLMEAEREQGMIMRKYADDTFRQDRKNRAAFKGLLDRLVEQGKINAESLWRIVYPDIAETEEYKQMVGQLGTTPLDFFKIKVDDLQESLYQDKKLVKEIFKGKGFVVTTDTTAEAFLEALQSDERVARISAVNMKFIFENLLEKALAKAKEEEEAKYKYGDDRDQAFLDLLSRNLITFNKDSQWSDISPLFKDEEAVKAYGDDTDKLEAAFQAYIAMDPWSRAEADAKAKPETTPDGKRKGNSSPGSSKKAKLEEGPIEATA